MNSRNSNTPNIDYSLIFIIILLGIVSCFTIYSLQPTLDQNYFLKQVVWYIVGSMAIAVIMLVDYDRLRQITWYLYGIGMILLLMLFFNFPGPPFIKTVNGATSWMQIPVFGTMQPAEFMKVFLVIALAHIIVNHNEKTKYKSNKSDLWLLAKILLISLPPMGLVATQPDLGGFLVLSAIVACIVLVSGIRWRILASILGSVAIVASIIVLLFIYFPEETDAFMDKSGFDHVEARFNGWLDPEKYGKSGGYQLVLAMMAIGSGQLTGKGFREFEVTEIPEQHTDMIFTAISEQFGFLGSSILVTLFFLLIYRLIHIALQSNDPFGSYLITGFIGMFTFQIFQNIGMSIQLLPITGLPLPFISYGGSSTLTYLMAIGIVLNIHSRTKQYMFD
ncbi:rod shape-determining protein RodA [Radiobacillus kanasensis]|uniref:FtsW/RodA/SpoVE family cell cycle protein n=1 Tax=Radiobacillus kanasensis TaxID=2844358 RepID=UPI001E5A0D2E|nr:FtsW/RodA/SpoVE family cell cycle protein [Radiobacillus kanasensis]UFU00585.1 rod shape-determining protein RodA [Radiobacillus kanasensis]